MPHVGFTQQFDIPELLVILFALFFLGLVYHIRGEDKREGYPLESDRTDNTGGRVRVVGFPPIPKPKIFLRKFGEPILAPGPRRERDLTGLLVPRFNFLGSPYVPVGDPLVDGVGPASYVLKEEVPERTWHGEPNIRPLRLMPGHALEGTETSPIGMDVVTRDRVKVGRVVDLWIDVSELFARYLEVEAVPALGGDRVILPVAFADLRPRRKQAIVNMLTADQFARVPRLAALDIINFREEDRINAYYAGGYLYSKQLERERRA